MEKEDKHYLNKIINISLPVQNIREEYIDEYHQPFGNLYLGGAGALKSELLKQYNITSVLTVIDAGKYKSLRVKEKISKGILGINIEKQQQYEKIDKKINERHLWIQIADHQNAYIQRHFENSYQFIKDNLLKMKEIQQNLKKKSNNETKRGNVLVHCMGGISRSSTIVIAFLMKWIFQNTKNQQKIEKQIINYETILKYVKNRHQRTKPNVGFEKQLRLFQQKLNSMNYQQQKEKEKMEKNQI